uniref:NADAR domain-containing protein n=1 Tax=Chromera velia CCMP2878 TaxID=1169474 RepID=A0A0G4GL67_9ALVE|eukprot:Cvel_22405.t1-p1 / transcript=Cvel_22405.t1 / gene=Cvel_22405 / organism=Chromera_velia_CCMP2878 / gene_product=Uncharacterized protein R617, putative / transcript_product=Uncharacterized protein R617, putative / location=Cvel_scaffold2198:13276-16101(-) / protein_length=236 / sequence_SO=supercontig / SO=protein_coding / is_pseudo=false
MQAAPRVAIMTPQRIQRYKGRFPEQFYQLIANPPKLLEYVRDSHELRKTFDKDKAESFWTEKEVFSNFNAEFPFAVEVEPDGNPETQPQRIDFPFLEKFLMWGKALLFDQEMAAEILVASKPKECKAMGRKVRNYDDEVWAAQRYNWMVHGLLLKAAHVPEFRQYLIEKGEFAIEGSPFDTIWGVGLHFQKDEVTNVNKWRGPNLLGFAIMEARAVLLSQQAGGGGAEQPGGAQQA